MTARVLVVDDIIANVKLLGARLTAEYFEVLSASSGQQAIDIEKLVADDDVVLDQPEADQALEHFTCRRVGDHRADQRQTSPKRPGSSRLGVNPAPSRIDVDVTVRTGDIKREPRTQADR